MNKEVFPEYSFDVLYKIIANQNLNQFYLVGGTALAFQIGHRTSIDLDFFTQEEFEPTLITEISDLTYSTNILKRNSINIIASNTKVTFLYWPFPILHDFIIDENVKMLHPIDIGLLKLLALQGRTTRKDIIDLYFIDKEVIPLEDLLDLFEKHYPKESFNIFGSLKEIFDMDALNRDIMPRMFKEMDWDEGLKLVQDKVAKHLKKLIS